MLYGERTLRHLLQPISEILATPGVTEIVCNRAGEIGIEKDGEWSWVAAPEFTFDRLDAIGILAGQMSAREFSPENPICLATLPDGQRYTTSRPPVTPQGQISVTIRVPSQVTRTVDDDDFDSMMRETNTGPGKHAEADKELIKLYRAGSWQKFFNLAVRSGKNIIATGSVGSGKTSFIKRLSQAIPLDERVITVEDTDEYGVMPHRNRVSSFYGSAGITAEHAIQLCLRQRPDRVLMQELRGPEAFSYMRVLLAGFVGGGLTTLHAEKGADEALDALSVMIKMHPDFDMPDDKLTRLLRKLVDVVAWCVKDSSGFHVPYVWFREAEISQ